MPVSQDIFIKNANFILEILGYEWRFDKNGICFGLSLEYLLAAKEKKLDDFFFKKKMICSLSRASFLKIALHKKSPSHLSFTQDSKSCTLNSLIIFCKKIYDAHYSQKTSSYKIIMANWEKTHCIKIDKSIQKELEQVVLNSGDYFEVSFFYPYMHSRAFRKNMESNGYYYFDPDIGEEKYAKNIKELISHLCSYVNAQKDIEKDQCYINVSALTYGNYQSSLIRYIESVNTFNVSSFDKNWEKMIAPAYENFKRGKISRNSLYMAMN